MTLASGTLGGRVADAMYVRTPPTIALSIQSSILALPDSGRVNILEPTAGTGELLAPFIQRGAHIVAVELETERVAQLKKLREARRTGGMEMHIYESPFQDTRHTQEYGLALVNPPYYFQNGRRAEYSIIRDTGNTLVPGGILVMVISARASIEQHLTNYLARHFEELRCWKFPNRGDHWQDYEDSFEHFTQVVIVGRKRQQPLSNPDAEVKAQITGWRWNSKKGEWGGQPPADLPQPGEPIDHPYHVPEATAEPKVHTIKSTESVLLNALEHHGAHHSQKWSSASAWSPETAHTDQLVMNVYGPAHVAALVLNTEEFRGKPIAGPDGHTYIFHSHVANEMIQTEPEDEDKAKGVVDIKQQQDKPVLVTLREDGELNVYQRDQVFAFLRPWLPMLTEQIVERHVPIYQLDPTDDEIRVVASVCQDKTLPGQQRPGLLIAQQHRVYAMHRATEKKGFAAIQGEPGTGKTRQTIALMALKAHQWQKR
jgi:16S rRNA G966 N2-methylase RsmD